ncbi:MAG: glycosyltransferase family 4 protein [Chloroflexota bacterium]
MHIAFLLTQSLESPSGLGRYSPLAKELARLGHTIHIFALHPDFASLAQKNFEQDGVKIHYVAPMHVRKHGSLKSYYSTPQLLSVASQATWQLCRAALATPAEIIHVFKPHPMNSLAGLAARYLRGRRLFLDCDDYEAALGHFTSGWQRWGVALFEKTTPRYAHTVTTHTHFMKSKLLEWGVAEERIVYLPNGIDRQRFQPVDLERVATRRAQLGLENRPVAAYIGSLGLASHAVDLLLEAFAQVHHTLPESRLLMVGGGEDFEKLQTQGNALGLGDAVLWVGRVPPNEVPMYYHLANVSVDPVRDDGAARGRSPLKLFESWATGVPFVTADVGERRRLLGSPPAGILAEPGNAAALATAILQILGNTELASSLSGLGALRLEGFTWDKLALDLEKAYQR